LQPPSAARTVQDNVQRATHGPVTQACACSRRYHRLSTAAEGHVAIVQSQQSVIGDGDAMGIGTEIAQHVFRPAEGWLGVDDPVMAEQ
jgi:hypothetical protein